MHQPDKVDLQLVTRYILSASAPLLVSLWHMKPSHEAPNANLPASQSLLRDTVSKLSLKPTPTLKKQLQRLQEWRATEKIEHKTK